MPDVRPAHRPARDASPADEAGSSRVVARHPSPPASPFARLALTHAIHVASEAFVTVALAGTLFFTVSPGDARPRVALFLVLTMAPFALLAPVLGPLIDRPSRRGRRLFVVATALVRAVVVFLMARHRDSLLLFPEAFGVLVLSKGYAVAKSALVPAVVEEDRSLVEANSRLALIGVVAGFVGGVPAAGILKLLGSQWVLLVASVGYVAMAITALRLPRAAPRPPAHAELERAELRRPTVLLSATAMAVLRSGVGFLTFFLAFALKDAGEPAWFYGAVLAASAAGGFAGAVGAPVLRRRIREEAILF
ncbi:MAG TPA: MFS transporter, partial [Acidimicrobiia bacterium]|nr:MFS transporter [Acidimicrobiia bacterium]